jgi:hypothetical protein
MNASEICNLLFNIDFWSASSGFIGTLIIFFFGLPPGINTEGQINLILEQTDKKMANKAKFYKKLSYCGILLLSISFLLQLIKLL